MYYALMWFWICRWFKDAPQAWIVMCPEACCLSKPLHAVLNFLFTAAMCGNLSGHLQRLEPQDQIDLFPGYPISLFWVAILFPLVIISTRTLVITLHQIYTKQDYTWYMSLRIMVIKEDIRDFLQQSIPEHATIP